MDSNIKYELLDEYYNIVSPLLFYESCETICETEQKVLALLCEIKDGDGLIAECWKMIENAKCLQTRSDVALLDSSDIFYDGIAYDIKCDVLVANDIKKVKRFNEISFVGKIKDNANMGDINACKLLAIMNWTGSLLPQNKSVAKKIWSFLAMSGDLLSLEMLINALDSEEEREQKQRWLHIKNILEAEYNSFSAIATYSNHPIYSKKEVQIANLIMFISQKSTKNGVKVIDRPMLQYAIDSADDYRSKMLKISSNTNYYLAMDFESEYSNKKIGF